MAQPANTFSSYDAVGNRESLHNMIYDTQPTEYPVTNAIGRETASATLEEWQTVALITGVSTNAVIEGDDTATDASDATTRLSNRTQIMDQAVIVTKTQEKVKKAGRVSEMEFQIKRKMIKIKSDLEVTLCDNGASVAGDDTTAREMAGIPAYLTSNTSFGASGADPVTLGSTARTDGTQRAYTEDMLKAVLQDCYTNGGHPTLHISGAFNRRKASEFLGNATRMDKSEDQKVYATVRSYMSDFGEVDFMPSRHCRTRDVLLIDPEMMAVAWLREFDIEDMPSNGSYKKKSIEGEMTLKVHNEAAHAGIFDLTTS